MTATEPQVSRAGRPEPFAAPKGIPEYLPPSSAGFVHVRDTLAAAAERAGYGHIELPVFEDTGLYARGVGSPPTSSPRRCTPSPTAATAR